MLIRSWTLDFSLTFLSFVAYTYLSWTEFFRIRYFSYRIRKSALRDERNKTVTGKNKSYFSVFILLYLYILCLCVRAFSTSLISCLPVHPFQKLEPCFSRSFKSSLITLWLSSNYVCILHLSFSFYKWCIVLFSLCLTLFCVCLCDQLYSRFVCYICLLILCRIFLCIFSHTSSLVFFLPFLTTF